MNKITENTFIPLSLLTAVVAGAFWLAAMSSKTDANAADVLEIKEDVHGIIELGREQRREDREYIEKRFDRLEGKLDSLLKR
jgi:sensor domain CHASE-containing protein